MIIPVAGRGRRFRQSSCFGNRTHQRSLFLYNLLSTYKDNIAEISVKLFDYYKMNLLTGFIVSIFSLTVKKKSRNTLVNGCIGHVITETLEGLGEHLIFAPGVHCHISLLLFICVIFL